MYGLKPRNEELCSAGEPLGRSFFVRYLGCNRFQSKAKQRGLKALQRPLLDLYSTARRKGEDRRSLHPLALTQRLDVSHYGLVVAEPVDDPETRETVTAVTRVITPASNVVLWAALRFSARLAKRRSIGAAFVPLACSEDVVDRSWYVSLPIKRRFLVGLAHPPLFACLFRQVAAPKTWECHAFLCASAEDALLICSSLADARNSVVVVDRPPRFLRPDYSDFSDECAFTSCASSYTPRHFDQCGKQPSSIDEPQSSVTASASGYYQVIDRRVKSPRRPSKRFSPRTDTESKSSISEDRKRRVRRRSTAHKHRDDPGASSSSPVKTSPDSHSSLGNGHVAHVQISPVILASQKSIKETTLYQDGLKSPDDLSERKSSDDTSSGQTPTNDTGYFSSKSKSGNASKETDREEAPNVTAPAAPPKAPQSTYYFGQHSTHVTGVANDKPKSHVATSYTYFLNDSAKTAAWKRQDAATQRSVVALRAKGSASDSSLSGYHSDSCCQTRDAGTMTKDSCCYSDCCCCCEVSSVCSECSEGHCACGCRKTRTEMTVSETMNLSSECSEAEPSWTPQHPGETESYVYALPHSSDLRVRGRSEGTTAVVGRQFQTQAQVHHYNEGDFRRTARDPRATKNASTSTIQGNGTSRVVIDVQYDSPKPNSIPPGVIGFNKHGHVRDWASLSRCSDSSLVTSRTQRATTTTKAIRWSKADQRQRTGLLSSLKKLSISSFSRAKRKTGKLFSNVRTRMTAKTRQEDGDNSAAPSEVCLSPDGGIKRKKKRRRLSWSFHDLRSAFPSMGNGHGGSKGAVVTQRPRKKKKKKRSPDETQEHMSETSDSGMDDPRVSYGRHEQRRKSDSELRHFASEVTHIHVHHGITKDNFKRWSNTNLHSELGYIP